MILKIWTVDFTRGHWDAAGGPNPLHFCAQIFIRTQSHPLWLQVPNSVVATEIISIHHLKYILPAMDSTRIER